MSFSASSNADSRTETQNDQRERQPAKRVFAREFQDATHIFAESDAERAPKFALLPTGERANRLAVVGTLTEAEDKGSESTFLQARIVDPTGTHFVYAGRYQPESVRALQELEPPAYVAVVGKPRSYTNDDGETYTSLTAEAVSEVDSATRNRWVLETTKHTTNRINTFEAYRRSNKNDCSNALDSSDNPSEVPEDVTRADEQYGDDLRPYIDCVVDSITDLVDQDSGSTESTEAA